MFITFISVVNILISGDFLDISIFILTPSVFLLFLPFPLLLKSPYFPRYLIRSLVHYYFPLYCFPNPPYWQWCSFTFLVSVVTEVYILTYEELELRASMRENMCCLSFCILFISLNMIFC